MEINTLYERALRGGEADSNMLFGTLSARFRLVVRLRVSNREEAEDIVQESLAVISAEYRQIQIHSSFAAWAYAVLKNRILASLDKKRTDSLRNVPLESSEKSLSGAHDDRLARLRGVLKACLKKVAQSSRRYARTLNLHYQGYSTDEICTRLGMRSSNLYSTLSRARDLLEKCVEERRRNG